VIERGLQTLDIHRQHSAQAKHERLRDHFVKEMMSGRLKPGEAIPSEHRLVETLGIARTTVRQAMASLENEGLIRRIQGKGTFVDENARQKLQRGLDIFALVVPETRGGFYPSLLHGFETAAGGIHHQAIVCSTDNDVARQGDIILQLIDKKIGGAAMVPASDPPTPAYQIRQLQEHGIPVVFCHRRVEGIAAPLLSIPFREVGRRAGQVLAQHGHRRVLCLATLLSATSQAYRDGLNDSLREANADAEVELVCVGETISPSEEAVLAAMQRALDRPDRPTAIFASFDSLAEMIYILTPRLGLRVPEDISLIGFGGAWREGVLLRRISSVVVDEIATGQQAVSLLHEMRRGERPIDDNSEFIMQLDVSQGETICSPAPV